MDNPQVPPSASSQITFTIEPPELRSELGGATKHHEYHIHGVDKIGEFDIWRRYSDFVVLKQYLHARWPGVYVPGLPEKKFLGNNESLFLEVRRQGLESWVRLISEQEHLWYGDEFQLFVKSKSHEVDKFLANLGKTNTKQIAHKYKTKFASILPNPQKQPPSDNDSINSQKIAQFRAYLKNAYLILQKLAKVTEVMNDDRRKFNDKYQILLTNILPAYQEQCVAEYTDEKDKLWFVNWKVNGLAQAQVNLGKAMARNPISIVFQLIKEELRELNNFQELLKNKEEYESIRLKAMSRKKDLQLEQSKINAGKQSILNKIKKSSKEQQLKQNKLALLKATEQLSDAQQLCRYIDRILVHDQIGKFRQARQKNYYRIVREMARAQKENLVMEEEFWARMAGDGDGDGEEGQMGGFVMGKIGKDNNYGIGCEILSKREEKIQYGDEKEEKKQDKGEKKQQKKEEKSQQKTQTTLHEPESSTQPQRKPSTEQIDD